MWRGRGNERFLRLELRNQRLASLRGIHTSVQKERRGIRIEIQRVLRDVNDRIRKQQQPGGKRLNIHAALSEIESQRKIIGRIGLLKIGLHDRVFDQIQRLRRLVQLKKKRRGIKLKNVVGLLRRQHFLQATHALVPFRLKLLLLNFTLLALHVNLRLL